MNILEVKILPDFLQVNNAQKDDISDYSQCSLYPTLKYE